MIGSACPRFLLNRLRRCKGAFHEIPPTPAFVPSSTMLSRRGSTAPSPRHNDQTNETEIADMAQPMSRFGKERTTLGYEVSCVLAGMPQRPRFFLDNGTLLGLWRGGELIENDDDFDFAYDLGFNHKSACAKSLVSNSSDSSPSLSRDIFIVLVTLLAVSSIYLTFPLVASAFPFDTYVKTATAFLVHSRFLFFFRAIIDRATFTLF